jgi:3D (Asp-Asp-Asp) domain-containing protein
MNAITALMGVFLLSSAGSAAPIASAVPPVQEAPSYEVKLTAYNAVAAQTDDNPFVTASGAYSNPEVVAARSRDLADELPFGTIIAIGRPVSPTVNCGFDAAASQIGYRVIADSMNSRKVNQVDILLDQTKTVPVSGKAVNPSLALGICDGVTIRVVGHVAMKDIPSTQSQLAQLVTSGALAIK